MDGCKAFWGKLPMNMNDMSTGNNKRLADTLIVKQGQRYWKTMMNTSNSTEAVWNHMQNRTLKPLYEVNGGQTDQ